MGMFLPTQGRLLADFKKVVVLFGYSIFEYIGNKKGEYDLFSRLAICRF
jgi:hypothetical protein